MFTGATYRAIDDPKAAASSESWPRRGRLKKAALLLWVQCLQILRMTQHLTHHLLDPHMYIYKILELKNSIYIFS